MNNTLVKKSIRWDVDKPVSLLKYSNVHTVCEESRCPNRHECSAAGVATFLIGGGSCTRRCSFCHIATGRGEDMAALRRKEMHDILTAQQAAGHDYLVITSVARDDRERELAEHFADLTGALKKRGVDVELLIPDFHGRDEYLGIIGEAGPLVLAHNIETVERLSPDVRPQAAYRRTLGVFDYYHRDYPEIYLKSGMMVGLGETMTEIEKTLYDLREHHVEIVTIGQYMRPSEEQGEVFKLYNSKEFAEIERMVVNAGFAGYEVGAHVRSSYMASHTMQKVFEARKGRLK